MSRAPSVTPYGAPNQDPVDPATLSRFMFKRLAPQVMEAYVLIADGPFQDAVVQHIQAIAQASMVTSGDPIDPLRVFVDSQVVEAVAEAEPDPAQPVALEPPLKLRTRKGASVEEQIVNLRMARRYPDEIAKQLDVDAGWVSEVLAKARDQGGLKYPKLPSRDHNKPVFHTDLKLVNNMARSKLEAVAVKYGMSLQQLFSARALFVEMRLAGRPMDDIARMTRIPEKDLWQWLYKARAAGIGLPLDVAVAGDAGRPPLPIRPAGAPIRLPSYAHHIALPQGRGRGAANKMATAAKNRGLSIPDYEYLREVVVDLALTGMSNIEIAAKVGEPPATTLGMLFYAERRGIPIPDGVRAQRAPIKPKPEPVEPQVDTGLSVVGQALAKLPAYEAMGAPQKHMIHAACEKRGITVGEYFSRRDHAVAYRFEGLTYPQIAVKIGDTAQSVRDWCKQAMNFGVEFPPSGIPQPGTLAAE